MRLKTIWPLHYLKFHMELFQVLQNTDFDYDPYKKQRFIQAWKSYGNERNEYIPIVQNSIVRVQNLSPEQSIIRNKIKFLQHKQQQYLIANTYGKLAYCSFNSKKVDIVIIQEDDNEQKQFNLDEYTGLYSNQGITGIYFATPSILTLVSLNYLYIVPIHKKIQYVKELDLLSGQTRVLQRSQRYSIRSNLNIFSYFSIFNRVFNMIKSNQRLCLVTSDQSTIIYVIDIFTNELINQLNFNSKVICFDLNNNDQVLVGLSNQSMHYRDLRTGEQNDYYFKQNVVCIAFQNFSFVQTLEQIQQNQFFNKNQMAHSKLSGSSTFQSSIMDKLFQDQNNVIKQSGMAQECQNLAVFALHNDVVLFQLNVKQQKIVKTFDFSVQVQSDSNLEVGGKILDVKWKDCCLVIKFKNNVLVSMLHNTSLVMIGGLIETDENAEIDAGQLVTLCNAGQIESYIV